MASISITHPRGGFSRFEFTDGMTIAQALGKYYDCNPADVMGCLKSKNETAFVGGVEVSAATVNNALAGTEVIALYSQAVAAGGVKGARSRS